MSEEIVSPSLVSATERIKHLLQNISKNAYEIGVSLNKVKKTGTWATVHDSYERWIDDLGISIQTANGLAKVARTFTKDEYLKFMELGQTKLLLLTSAPLEDRDELGEKAKKLDPKFLKRAIKKARAGRGEIVTKKDPGPPSPKQIVVEFTRWVASFPCKNGNSCILNESVNTGESCMVHAARGVLAGYRLPLKLLRRIK